LFWFRGMKPNGTKNRAKDENQVSEKINEVGFFLRILSERVFLWFLRQKPLHIRVFELSGKRGFFLWR
jgi:hypothetical protein